LGVTALSALSFSLRDLGFMAAPFEKNGSGQKRPRKINDKPDRNHRSPARIKRETARGLKGKVKKSAVNDERGRYWRAGSAGEPHGQDRNQHGPADERGMNDEARPATLPMNRFAVSALYRLLRACNRATRAT
jgi:hypothetical protein